MRLDTENIGTALQKKMDIVYLDIDSLPHEGFTSGLLITVRETLQRIFELGHHTRIASVSNSNKDELVEKKIDNIDITEYHFSDLERNISSVRDAINEQVSSADVILLNTPAVFISPIHNIALQECIDTQKQVIVLVMDELFPDSPKDGVEDYFIKLKSENVNTMAVSDRMREKFQEVSGVYPSLFPTMYPLDKVIVDREEIGNGNYITMVNTHPIKGIDVFNETAGFLPDRKFLAIENWVDVPDYKPGYSNIQVRPFFQDPRDFYKLSRTLMIPSLCNEGASRVAIESMLNGIPVIAHRIGSLPEIGKKAMSYVEPPHVNSYRFEGSIMYPVIEDGEVTRAASDFAKQIRIVDGNYEYFSGESKRQAMEYRSIHLELFNQILNNWTMKS